MVAKMIKYSTASLLLSSITLLISQSIQADVKDIVSANSQIGAQFVTTNVDYTETSKEGVKLDTEQAFVPGFGTSLSVMKNLLFGNDYLAFQFSKLNGNTDYVGGMNTPTFASTYSTSNYGSLIQSNGAEIMDFSGKVGKGFELSNSTMLTPYFEIGHHNWNRQINSTSPVIAVNNSNGVTSKEDYNNYYFGFGTMGQFTPINKLVISANAMVGGIFSPTMSATLTGAPAPVGGVGILNYSNTFNLGSSVIYKFGLSFDYAIYKNLHANAGAEYSAFNYVNSSTSGSAYEPSSQTNYTTVRTGLGYSF
jgi:hypothetical protein